MIRTRIETPINAVVSDTTSQPISVREAVRVSLYFTASGIGTGNCAWSVKTSADDSTYVAYNKLIDNVTNTNAQNLTRISSKTQSSDGTIGPFTFSPEDKFSSFKVVADVTTDGTYTCKAVIEDVT